MNEPVIIVGTGLAGMSVAREFRKLDPTTPLVMVTADDGRVYSKPMLSNAFAKDKDAISLASTDAAGLASQINGAVLPKTRITAIDPGAHTVTAGERVMRYGKLVLALGAEQIRLPLEGDAAASVLSVNSLEDYGQFRHRLDGRKHVTILGAGLIGCEFANDFSAAGIQVDLIDLAPTPLNRLMPPRSGLALQHALESLGVRFHLGTSVASVRSDDSAQCGGDGGCASIVELKDGTIIRTELVLSAIGLRPMLGLAKAAGLATNRGVVVDRLLRTSSPDIYCLGDCMEVENLVLPYIMPIMYQARTLAKVLAGDTSTPLTYPAMPVLVKTPVHPIIVAPPPMNAPGDWSVEGDDAGTKALFRSPDGALLGFALTGGYTKERAALAKDLPDILK